MSILWRIVEFVRTWYGGTATVVSLILALYYGLPQLLRTWDWYVERYDGKVLRAVARKPAPRRLEIAPQVLIRSLPHQVSDLVKTTKRSERSVKKSLKRLADREEVEFVDGGWRKKSEK